MAASYKQIDQMISIIRRYLPEDKVRCLVSDLRAEVIWANPSVMETLRRLDEAVKEEQI